MDFMHNAQRPRTLWIFLFLALGALTARAAPAEDHPLAGLSRILVPATDSYFWRYVPPDLPVDRPAPVVVFFHGSGGKPENYLSFVTGPAQAAGCILVLPRSKSSLGWGGGGSVDELTVAESLRMVREALAVDDRRIAVAGHSAGGAYAYLLAYEKVLRFSAVFSMAARYYPIGAVADPAYKAPIRMYYGTADPNYSGGSYALLKQQWQRLGIPSEEEIRPGAPHQDMSQDSITRGFQFLVSKSYPAAATGCAPGPQRLCLADGRFLVEVTWRDFAGQTGAGSVVPSTTEDSGLFWFFDASNWELLVKVLDGCAINGHHWVFAAATTSVEYTLTVTDTHTGQTAVYHNPLGQAAVALNDTQALGGCP
jgi:predicted esterase